MNVLVREYWGDFFKELLKESVDEFGDRIHRAELAVRGGTAVAGCQNAWLSQTPRLGMTYEANMDILLTLSYCEYPI